MDMALKMYDARKDGSLKHALKYAQELQHDGKTNNVIFEDVQKLFGDDLSDEEIQEIIKSL